MKDSNTGRNKNKCRQKLKAEPENEEMGKQTIDTVTAMQLHQPDNHFSPGAKGITGKLQGHITPECFVSQVNPFSTAKADAVAPSRTRKRLDDDLFCVSKTSRAMEKDLKLGNNKAQKQHDTSSPRQALLVEEPSGSSELRKDSFHLKATNYRRATNMQPNQPQPPGTPLGGDGGAYRSELDILRERSMVDEIVAKILVNLNSKVAPETYTVAQAAASQVYRTMNEELNRKHVQLERLKLYTKSLSMKLRHLQHQQAHEFHQTANEVYFHHPNPLLDQVSQMDYGNLSSHWNVANQSEPEKDSMSYMKSNSAFRSHGLSVSEDREISKECDAPSPRQQREYPQYHSAHNFHDSIGQEQVDYSHRVRERIEPPSHDIIQAPFEEFPSNEFPTKPHAAKVKPAKNEPSAAATSEFVEIREGSHGNTEPDKDFEAIKETPTNVRNAKYPKSRWSEEQDESLRKAVELYGGKRWKKIAEHVDGRNHVQCLQRWRKVLQPGLIKGPWTPQEDSILSKLLLEQRLSSWTQISNFVPGRTAKQCRERWTLSLDPSINRDAWTKREDEVLLNLHLKLGNRWSEIKDYFNGRTENAVKSRYKSLVRAQSKEWTEVQDEKLMNAYTLLARVGEERINWKSLQSMNPGRTELELRLRVQALLHVPQASSPKTLQRDAQDS